MVRVHKSRLILTFSHNVVWGVDASAERGRLWLGVNELLMSKMCYFIQDASIWSLDVIRANTGITYLLQLISLSAGA